MLERCKVSAELVPVPGYVGGGEGLKLLAPSLCCLMISLLETSEAAWSSGDQARGSLLGRGLWIGYMLVLEKAWAIVPRVLRVPTGPS